MFGWLAMLLDGNIAVGVRGDHPDRSHGSAQRQELLAELLPGLSISRAAESG